MGRLGGQLFRESTLSSFGESPRIILSMVRIVALELELKFGIAHSSATIRKYRARGGSRNSQAWRTFLRNQSKAIWSCDFFVQYTGRDSNLERFASRLSAGSLSLYSTPGPVVSGMALLPTCARLTFRVSATPVETNQGVNNDTFVAQDPTKTLLVAWCLSAGSTGSNFCGPRGVRAKLLKGLVGTRRFELRTP